MSDESSAYNEDPRKACRYGSDCQQKDPNHHSTFKHPPQLKNKVTEKRAKQRCSPFSRESKADKPEKEKIKVEEVTIDPPLVVIDKTTEESSDDTVNKIVLPKDITYYESSDRAILKELFLVEMPDDFFKFYEFLNSDGAIVQTLAYVELELIGPYDLLLGKLPKLDDKELYLVHWRFFYDPPEFQAVLKKKGKSEYHIGYFRDDPNEKPAFVGSNDSGKDCRITILADNIFGALYHHLQKEKKYSPMLAMKCQKIMNNLKKYCEEKEISIDTFNMKKRKAVQVANTLHHAGIIEKYDKKTKLGYRPLVETDENLRKIFNKLKDATTKEAKDDALSELQPVISYASIAIDECDFGTGLELGIDLFCSGLKELELSALSNLSTAYSLLERKTFIKIIEAHLKYRRKGPNMSILAED